MAKLYKSMVCDSLFREDGVAVWTSHGDAVTVDGVQMVRLAGGFIHPADGYAATKSEAVLVAAARVEELGRLLMAQASRMRVEAYSSNESIVTKPTEALVAT